MEVVGSQSIGASDRDRRTRDASILQLVSGDRAVERSPQRLPAHPEDVRALMATLAVVTSRGTPPAAVANGTQYRERELERGA